MRVDVYSELCTVLYLLKQWTISLHTSTFWSANAFLTSATTFFKLQIMRIYCLPVHPWGFLPVLLPWKPARKTISWPYRWNNSCLDFSEVSSIAWAGIADLIHFFPFCFHHLQGTQDNIWMKSAFSWDIECLHSWSPGICGMRLGIESINPFGLYKFIPIELLPQMKLFFCFTSFPRQFCSSLCIRSIQIWLDL